jgi:putative acetyltransferase
MPSTIAGVESEIRSVAQNEVELVCEVHRVAFDGREEEPRLVQLLHAAGKTPISLAAHLEGKIVGHVLFSPMILDPPKPCLSIVGLAPVGVLPEHQGRGIGSRLICEGLSACSEAGFGAAVVLGEPGYYGRLGFGRASERGIGNEYGVDEPFMVVELKKGALDVASVTVKYQPEFRRCGL